LDSESVLLLLTFIATWIFGRFSLSLFWWLCII